MIDIVIPTMMKAPFGCLSYSLHEAISSDYINKIHIIDNSGQKLFNQKNNIQDIHNKIIVHNMEHNIYVNPSWNLGSSFTTSNNILFMNDDVYVNNTIYQYIEEALLLSTVGLCSVETITVNNLEQYKNILSNQNNILSMNENFGNKRQNISGWFFAMKKNLWKNIPHDIKIFYGDTLIYQRMRHLGFLTKNIVNTRIGHIKHATVKKSFGYIQNRNKITRRDRVLFRQNIMSYIKD